MAEGARWNRTTGHAIERNSAVPRRVCGQSEFSPICSLHYAFDLVDDTDAPRPSLVSCYADATGWCIAGASKKRRPSKSSFRTRLAECRLEPASNQDQGCLLQRRTGRRSKYPNVKLTSSATALRPRRVLNHRDNTAVRGSLLPSASRQSKAMRATIRELGFRRRTELSWQISPTDQSTPAGVACVLWAIRAHRRSHPCFATSI